ncbi:MAG TPA: hypothetical protein VF121_10355 [Thermoanaerobaculia bacterium]|nr:hypothetical protein [Thermoanaerobaculia bacterium]
MSREISEMWTPLAAARAEAAARLAAERQAAIAAVAELLALPPEERRRRIRDEQRFRTVAVAALLLEGSFATAAEDPDLGGELAFLAVEVLGQVDRERERPRLVDELEAWAWGLAAYACWAAPRWNAAFDALQHAETRLAGAGHDTPALDLRRPPRPSRESAREEATRLGRLTQAVLALVRTLEADPDPTEE